MLERLVVTLTVSTLSLTVGGSYAWAQGAFDPADVAPVAQRGTTLDPGAPTGYGASAPRPTASPGEPARTDEPSTGAPAPWDPVPPVLAQLPTTGAAAVGSRTASTTSTSFFTPTSGWAPAATTGSTTGGTADSSTGSGSTGEPLPSTPAATPATSGTGNGGSSGSGPATFRVASLNVLGSSHTRPGGQRPSYAAGPARMPGVVSLLADNGVSVAGLQELQADQAVALERLTPGWETYPGSLRLPRSGPESLTWDRSVWTAVEKHLVDIPFMDGQERQMPYVLLKHRASGRTLWFSTVHFAPGNRGTGSRWRSVATDRQVALVNRLLATGHEHVVTGDMNEVERYYCRISGETPLRSAEGGSHHDGRCRPPAGARIDWILGTPGLQMSGFERRRDARTRAVTDHPLLLTDVALR